MLIWGSYKVGRIIATDKQIIFKALFKKFESLKKKLKFILDNNSYNLQDSIRKDLSMFIDNMIHIEKIFMKIIFKQTEENESLSINQFTQKLELSDFIKNNNIGNLIPLSCGHNGLYSEEEKELYTTYLAYFKFI